MEKLLELEKKLKQAKEELEKQGRFSGMAGSVNSTGGPSIASQIGFGKAEDEEKEEKEEEKKDEKKDKKLIARAIDKHNEKKHGEPKDENSAQKDMNIEKAEDKIKPTTDKVQRTAPGARQPAYQAELGNTYRSSPAPFTVITPAEQIKAKVDSAAKKKSKGEAEAAARRAQYRKEGVLKSDEMCKSNEDISFNSWGQWTLEKSKDMEVEVEKDITHSGDDQPRKGPKVKREKL